MEVTLEDARAIAATLPRSYEAAVRDEVRFRVGRLVYAAFSRDDTVMGFGFPKEERKALVASEPDKFLMPRPSDMRYRWVCVRLDADRPRRAPRAIGRRVADVCPAEGLRCLRRLTGVVDEGAVRSLCGYWPDAASSNAASGSSVAMTSLSSAGSRHS